MNAPAALKATPILSLRTIERIAFDSNAIIYFVEHFPRYFEILAPIFAKVERGECKAIVSVVAQAEALVKPLRLENRYAEAGFLTFFSAPGVQVVEVDEGIGLGAARLRARSGLSLPDAIIIETAYHMGCDAIYGNDRAWREHVTDIPYVYLDDAVGRSS
jgi:predicted nucleic acid-binding protein